MLNAEVPLVDFRVAGLIRSEIVTVAETPLRQCTIFRSLGQRQSGGEGIIKVRELRLVIVGGELDLGGLAERGAGVLEVRRHVHAVEDPRPAAEDGVGSQLVGEAKAWCPVIAVDGCRATRRTCKSRGSQNLSQSGDVNSGVAREIAELKPVEPLGVGITPFVAQAEIDGEFRGYFPVVLDKEGRFLRFVRHGRDDIDLTVTVVCEPRQKGRKREPLSFIPQAGIGLLRGHVAVDVEQPRGIVRLPEIVEELALLSTELDGMPSEYQLQRGRVSP